MKIPQYQETVLSEYALAIDSASSPTSDALLMRVLALPHLRREVAFVEWARQDGSVESLSALSNFLATESSEVVQTTASISR